MSMEPTALSESPGTLGVTTAMSVADVRGWPARGIRAFAWLLLVSTFLGRFCLAEYAARGNIEQLPDTVLYRLYARTVDGDYTAGQARALRMPGYPMFIALLEKNELLFTGDQTLRWILHAQAFLGCASVGWVYLIGRSLEQRGAAPGTAWLATLLSAVEPYGFLLVGLALSETLFTFLFLATIYLAMHPWSARPLLHAMLVGTLGAWSVYVRPSVLAVALAGSLLFGWRAWREHRLLPCMAVGLALVLWLAPWWVRNLQVLGTLVLTTTNVGESLYDGWNPQADGSSRFWFKHEPAIATMNEVEQDRYFRSQAITWARENGRRVIELAGIKFVRFWSPWPNEARLRSPAVVLGTTLITVGTYLLAIGGAWYGLRSGGGLRPWVVGSMVPIVVFCLLHLIFVSSVRYRVPIMPVLAVWGGMGCSAFLARGKVVSASRLVPAKQGGG
jgi:hypothetical protein